MQLPQPLLESLQHVPAFDPDAFALAHTQLPPVSIRVNANKHYDLSHFLPDGQVPWCASGMYLKERPLFTLDPGIHGGAYYVQEASSMFIEYAIRQLLPDDTGLFALDLCAAPGGKSTLLAAQPQFSMVLANEIIKTRVPVLYENAVKWGEPKLLVSNNDPFSFRQLPSFFDLVLVDAPCSGSGLFRKDKAAWEGWTLSQVKHCAERQQRILADALPTLNEGGILLYSTCSYSPEEDEDILDWLVEEQGMEPLDIAIPEAWGVVKTRSRSGGTGFRFFPDKLRGEGFFLACCRKGQVTAAAGNNQGRYENKVARASSIAGAKAWIGETETMAFLNKDADVFVIPAILETAVQELERALHLRKRGVRAGTVIRDQFIPDHELVMSSLLQETAPAIHVDRETALRYLRKQDILPVAEGRGWFVVKYQGLALGLLKHLGNRVNNYYPASWRILMS